MGKWSFENLKKPWDKKASRPLVPYDPYPLGRPDPRPGAMTPMIPTIDPATWGAEYPPEYPRGFASELEIYARLARPLLAQMTNWDGAIEWHVDTRPVAGFPSDSLEIVLRGRTQEHAFFTRYVASHEELRGRDPGDAMSQILERLIRQGREMADSREKKEEMAKKAGMVKKELPKVEMPDSKEYEELKELVASEAKKKPKEMELSDGKDAVGKALSEKDGEKGDKLLKEFSDWAKSEGKGADQKAAEEKMRELIKAAMEEKNAEFRAMLPVDGNVAWASEVPFIPWPARWLVQPLPIIVPHEQNVLKFRIKTRFMRSDKSAFVILRPATATDPVQWEVHKPTFEEDEDGRKGLELIGKCRLGEHEKLVDFVQKEIDTLELV